MTIKDYIKLHCLTRITLRCLGLIHGALRVFDEVDGLEGSSLFISEPGQETEIFPWQVYPYTIYALMLSLVLAPISWKYHRVEKWLEQRISSLGDKLEDNKYKCIISFYDFMLEKTYELYGVKFVKYFNRLSSKKNKMSADSINVIEEQIYYEYKRARHQYLSLKLGVGDE